MSDRIHQEIVYDAPAARIFEVLTSSELFSKMTGGAPTDISADVGSEFSVFGGMVHGRSIEVVDGELLVQAWRAKNWDRGVYSIVRFEMVTEGDQTRVLLDHAGYPEGQGGHLDEGWHTNYWEPLKKLLSA